MQHRYFLLVLLLGMASMLGCGSTKQHTVTEQLLSSDAVDRAVAQIDFRVLTGRKVYVDASYVQPIKNIGFVNDRYILSSLRQQMAAAGCLLQDSATEAEVIVEPRVGALGTDMHEVVYGIPANNLLANVANIAPNSPQLPAIPELSLAKKHQHLGAAKIAVFAYERESREPIWQSGIAQSDSKARDTWILGAGPFQSGAIYEHTYFAGSDFSVPLVHSPEPEVAEVELGFERAHVFVDLSPEEEMIEPELLAAEGVADESENSVVPVNHEAADASAMAKSSEANPAPAKTTTKSEDLTAKDPAAEPSPVPGNDDNASHLPADLMRYLDAYSQPIGQPVDPWYNPPTLSSMAN